MGTQGGWARWLIAALVCVTVAAAGLLWLVLPSAVRGEAGDAGGVASLGVGHRVSAYPPAHTTTDPVTRAVDVPQNSAGWDSVEQRDYAMKDIESRISISEAMGRSADPIEPPDWWDADIAREDALLRAEALAECGCPDEILEVSCEEYPCVFLMDPSDLAVGHCLLTCEAFGGFDYGRPAFKLPATCDRRYGEGFAVMHVPLASRDAEYVGQEAGSPTATRVLTSTLWRRSVELWEARDCP